MCNFSPSPQISRPEITPELAKAFEDLRRGVAKYVGWDEADTEMTICRPNQIETDEPNEEFFYEQHTY